MKEALFNVVTDLKLMVPSFSLPGRGARRRSPDHLGNLSFGRGFHLWANPEVKPRHPLKERTMKLSALERRHQSESHGAVHRGFAAHCHCPDAGVTRRRFRVTPPADEVFQEPSQKGSTKPPGIPGFGRAQVRWSPSRRASR